MMDTLDFSIQPCRGKPSEEWFSNIRRLLGGYSDLTTRAIYNYCFMGVDVSEYSVFINWLVHTVADKTAFTILIDEYNEHTQLEENNFTQRRKISEMGGATLLDYHSSKSILHSVFTPMDLLVAGNITFKENLFPIDTLRCKFTNFDFNLNSLCGLYE